jgi:ribosomal protein S26
VLAAPRHRKLRNTLERAGLLKQMRCPGNDFKLHWCVHAPHGCAIHLDHWRIIAADDQQRWRDDERQRIGREIGTAAP